MDVRIAARRRAKFGFVFARARHRARGVQQLVPAAPRRHQPGDGVGGDRAACSARRRRSRAGSSRASSRRTQLLPTARALAREIADNTQRRLGRARAPADVAHARRRPPDGGPQGRLARDLRDGPVARRATRACTSFLEKRPAQFTMKVSSDMPELLPVVEAEEVRVAGRKRSLRRKGRDPHAVQHPPADRRRSGAHTPGSRRLRQPVASEASGALGNNRTGLCPRDPDRGSDWRRPVPARARPPARRQLRPLPPPGPRLAPRSPPAPARRRAPGAARAPRRATTSRAARCRPAAPAAPRRRRSRAGARAPRSPPRRRDARGGRGCEHGPGCGRESR